MIVFIINYFLLRFLGCPTLRSYRRSEYSDTLLRRRKRPTVVSASDDSSAARVQLLNQLRAIVYVTLIPKQSTITALSIHFFAVLLFCGRTTTNGTTAPEVRIREVPKIMWKIAQWFW
uniref:Secreted protein n=1 Tax=Steinernema glaseri TaxID=37863 RepID=A0A1I7YSF5_9BILA